MSEYLISLSELFQGDINQRSLFIEVTNQCPICKKKKKHLDWWTCKECSKRLNVDKYIKELIKYFGKIYV